MQRITVPVSRNDRGPQVPDLQEGLLLLLDRGRIEVGDRLALVRKLLEDQHEPVYGDATREAVASFQRQYQQTFGLQHVSGEQVDRRTADALNRMLDELGAFPRTAD